MIIKHCHNFFVPCDPNRRPTKFPLKTAIHGELWDRNLLFRKKVVKSPYLNPHELELLKVDFEPAKATNGKDQQKRDGVDEDTDGRNFLHKILTKIWNFKKLALCTTQQEQSWQNQKLEVAGWLT